MKKIYQYTDVKDKIVRGLDTIANPVKQTLGPRGSNVLYEHGANHVLTNDGVTVAREINVSDQIENSIVEVVKGASIKTNSEAGDATTSTILLSQLLTKEGMKLLDEGYSWIEVRDKFNQMKDKILERLEKAKITIKGDKDLFNVAHISANNDKAIAQDIVEVVKTAGETGMVFIDRNSSKNETEIQKDLGFLIESGILFQELLQSPTRFTVTYDNPAVLITDKMVYYPEEAESILNQALEAGHKSVVIVAKDFKGECINTFITNHTQKVINVLLVKVDVKNDDTTVLHDLACYLGGKVITDKSGNLVNDLSKDDFIFAANVYSDPQKTLITPKISASKDLKERIKSIKAELEKDRDNAQLKKRLSSLTTGVVTIKVGGSTAVEVREKIFRYEDALNATRGAMKHGYLVGGGIGVMNIFNAKDYPDDVAPIARRYTEAIARQVAENAGKHPDTVLENIRGSKEPYYGYNALQNIYENLLKAGVIDSYIAVHQAIENSVSVANIIISTKNFIVEDLDYGDEKDKDQS